MGEPALLALPTCHATACSVCGGCMSFRLCFTLLQVFQYSVYSNEVSCCCVLTSTCLG